MKIRSLNLKEHGFLKSTTIKQKVNVCALLTRHILQQNFNRQNYILQNLIPSDFFTERDCLYNSNLTVQNDSLSTEK